MPTIPRAMSIIVVNYNKLTNKAPSIPNHTSSTSRPIVEEFVGPSCHVNVVNVAQ